MITEALIAAVMMVESGGDPGAIGDHHRARGILQVHAGVVRDVNRVYGTAFTHRQMHDPLVARDVFIRYLSHYVTAERIGHEPTAQDYARCWNGGPDGWREPATMTYWRRVRPHLVDHELTALSSTQPNPCPRILIVVPGDSPPPAIAVSSQTETQSAVRLEFATSTRTTGFSIPRLAGPASTSGTRTARLGTVFIAAAWIAPGWE